jgi:hypothetical protein
MEEEAMHTRPAVHAASFFPEGLPALIAHVTASPELSNEPAADPRGPLLLGVQSRNERKVMTETLRRRT